MLNEVLTMHLHRRVWQQARAITDANPTLPPSYWWDFMSDVYGYSQASAVRRLVDPQKDGVSLRRVLAEMTDDCHLVTFDYFMGLYPTQEAQRAAGAADWWREHFAGVVDTHVDRTIVQTDLDHIVAATAQVVAYVDRHVAHSDPRPVRLDQLPTFTDVHEAIDVIGTLFERYQMLLTGSSTPLTPVIPDDWRAVFRQPWMGSSSTAPRPAR